MTPITQTPDARVSHTRVQLRHPDDLCCRQVESAPSPKSGRGADIMYRPLRAISGHGSYQFRFTRGLETSRAQSMNSCAAGLRIRFFKVRIPIGPLTIDNSTGTFLMNGCLAGNVSADSGWIAR